MSDGAHMGVGAERALGTILGGEEQPEPEERMDPVKMRAEIEAQEGPSDYNGTAMYAAKLILHYFLDDPARAQYPNETEYEKNADGSTDFSRVKTPDLYARMKADGIDLAALDLTGFMWGWAVNAARYCVELPPVPNPAIVTIG